MNYKIIIVTTIVLVIIAIGGYFSAISLIKLPAIVSPMSLNTFAESDTTADIANDLNQTPSDADANNELNSLNQDLNSF